MESKNYSGEAYNFSIDNPKDVLEVVKSILKIMGKESVNRKIIPTLRMKSPRIFRQHQSDKTLGWKPVLTFDQRIDLTVRRYRAYFGKP